MRSGTAANRAPQERWTEYGESRVRWDRPSVLGESRSSLWIGAIYQHGRRFIGSLISRSSAAFARLEQFQIVGFSQRRLILAALLVASLPASAALSAEVVRLELKDHRFTPTEVSVPVGERFRIEVENRDTTPAEFESSDLRVEKIVVPGGKITVMAGPLKPGTYKFFDDYHPDTATGTITAKPKE